MRLRVDQARVPRWAMRPALRPAFALPLACISRRRRKPELLDTVTLRAAVVGGFPAGGLRRDRTATRSSSPLRGAGNSRGTPGRPVLSFRE